MKFSSVIFSVYILVLSCLPCGDVKDCEIFQNATVSYSNADHSDHENDEETCSPFCVCACCGTNITNNFFFQAVYSETQPSFYAQKLSIVYSGDSFYSNFCGNIWQPPKV